MKNKAGSPWDNQQTGKPEGWGQGGSKPAWSVPPARGEGKPPFSRPSPPPDIPPAKKALPQKEAHTVTPVQRTSATPQQKTAVAPVQPGSAPPRQEAAAVTPARSDSAPSPQKPSRQSAVSTNVSPRKSSLLFVLPLIAALLLLTGVAALLISGRDPGSTPPTAATTAVLPGTYSPETTTEAPTTAVPTVQTVPATDPAAITTQPTASPSAMHDPAQYLGEWKPGFGDGYTSVTVHSLDEEYAVFDLWFRRLVFFDYVGGPVSGNTVNFSTHASTEEPGITGTLTFTDSGILLTILQSDFDSLPPMEILYEYHAESSDHNQRQAQAVPYIVQLQSPFPVFEIPVYDIAFLCFTAEAGAYTIVEEAYDASGSLWGRLKSGAGWIRLDDFS